MPMKHRALISMLMLENVLRSYRRTCLQQPFTHRSSTVHHDGSRSQASCVLHAQARLAFVAAHRCSCARERLACGLRSSMLPCSRTPCFQRSSFNPAQPCARVVALACNSPVHTHRALIVPHRLAHPIKHRAFIHYSSTLKLENFLHTRRCVSSTSAASVYRCSVC